MSYVCLLSHGMGNRILSQSPGCTQAGENASPDWLQHVAMPHRSRCSLAHLTQCLTPSDLGWMHGFVISRIFSSVLFFAYTLDQITDCLQLFLGRQLFPSKLLQKKIFPICFIPKWPLVRNELFLLGEFKIYSIDFHIFGYLRTTYWLPTEL